MSNPLFTANRWDWQPHRKLGQSSLVVLCAGSTLLLAPTLHTRLFSGAVNCSLAPLPKSASNNLQKWFLSPTGRLNFGFILRENLLLCSSYLPLGVSQLVLWDITYHLFISSVHLYIQFQEEYSMTIIWCLYFVLFHFVYIWSIVLSSLFYFVNHY
jgi:hypothetical protein